MDIYSCQDINQELRSLQTALNVVDDELKLQKQRLHRQQSNNNISDENDNHVVDGDASTPAIINDTMIDQQQNIAGDRFVSVVDAFLCAARNDFADLNSLFADMKRSVCRVILIIYKLILLILVQHMCQKFWW